ncbi:MAG: NAD(P)/FAD-dependent oxidoreductase [Myxococcales bacterium]|nr:NAD(P)/FAD-dependent oxidoreductase [Myxococcales bacterium]
MARRLIVVGAGPIGLFAALAAAERGFAVTVLERGQVGAALRRWGEARLFSPLAMNLPPGARALLGDLPPDDALLTGPEMAARVLEPLARTPLLVGRVLTAHTVVAIGRARMNRTDYADHPLRAERPFRLLVDTPEGERTFEAEAVLDASGVYGQPLALSAGGLPARGERAVGDRLIRDLGGLHQRRADLRGKRVLLVGHGHSAAHAVALLDCLAREAPGTHAVWATRSLARRPCVEVADDPLPERQRVAAAANALAADPPGHLTVERRATVAAIAREGAALRVTLSGERAVTVDAIVALTGYRPDLSFLSELAIEIAPSTEGAARLTRAISSITDCLAVPKVVARDLASGEPGFHLVGAKSYGRSRTFLIKTGLAQLETILDALGSAA